MAERLREAAGRLSEAVKRKGYIPRGLHCYTNARGKPLYWRIRLKHPDTGEKWIRPIKLNGSGFVMGEPDFPQGKPLYALRRIVSKRRETASTDRETVWIVEGEQKADRLNKLGLVATTSGGATSAKGTDWQPLAGRRVVIWPDNDDPGKAYAGEVASILLGMGCTVSCVEVEKIGVGKNEDAVDWLQAHQGVTCADIEALPMVLAQPADRNAIQADTGPRVELVRGSDIRPESVTWLWDGWLAAGKLHVLAGAPGTGKTTIALALAATLTTGGRWPDGTKAQPRSVLIWSGEDDPKDTLAPRLLSCGADMNRIHFVGGVFEHNGKRPFDPASDIGVLQDGIERAGDVGLLIVDPIVSAVAADSHKNGDVRRALQPLVDLGVMTGCAVLGISHFSKGTSNRDPVERVTGSIAFGALARVVMATAKINDEDNGNWRLLARAKSNIGPDTGGFRYDLEQTELLEHRGVFASRILWGDPVEGSARELLATAETTPDTDGGESVESVASWLQDLLSEEGGRIDRRDVMRAAHAMGHKERTVHRAREKLGLAVKQHGFGKDKRSVWTWPDSPIPASIVPIVPSKLTGTHGTNGGTHAPVEPDFEVF